MIKYDLVGIDGNAFCIMGYVIECMRKERRPQWERDQYRAAAMSGDYNNLLCVSIEMIDTLNEPYKDLPGDEEVTMTRQEYDTLMTALMDMKAAVVQARLGTLKDEE